MVIQSFVDWLLGAALGPAAVSVPVSWAANTIAGSARHWFRRVHSRDDLSRLVRASTNCEVELTRAEFNDVRRLLEDERTWSVAGRGTVEDLATLIGSCLPPRGDRTAAVSHTAALTIARGLLEFAVADLDPRLFEQVLMARINRIEISQADALDHAMLVLHARITSLSGLLRQTLDRLPPGPAHQGEIVVYLTTLIDWLDRDPWPHDQRFKGPVLTPSTLERSLRIVGIGGTGNRVLDADDLAKQCARLVILGGPGSGKSWLARKTARRCADDALAALENGRGYDEIELPLFTTCSHLFGARRGNIRDAVVTSAIDQLADLGGSRISAALQAFFSERNRPTLLVIDALDEARGSDERLRQADTLPSTWRIVLTSRPSSWNHQLAINGADDSHRIGELQPLRYPADVEPFIYRWFAEESQRGVDLAAQIAGRPGLQMAATVPLILSFYCIIGGDQPLPGRQRDLYAKVLNRMLTGRWRGNDNYYPDPASCLQVLRAWAWSGTVSDHFSGVVIWPDDIVTPQVRLGEADGDAVDHVAVPVQRPDVDTGETLRRFVHHSIREHLVAEHVAGLPLDQAIDALLPHLWFDPAWEYSAPAALVMHPRRDQLLREIICRAAASDRVPSDLSVIDAGWQVRGLLAKVARESNEGDWSPEIAEIIGQARVELAGSSCFDSLGEEPSWEASSRQACRVLLARLTHETYPWTATRLTAVLARLGPTAIEKRQALDAMLRLLAHATHSHAAIDLVRRTSPARPCS